MLGHQPFYQASEAAAAAAALTSICIFGVTFRPQIMFLAVQLSIYLSFYQTSQQSDLCTGWLSRLCACGHLSFFLLLRKCIANASTRRKRVSMRESERGDRVSAKKGRRQASKQAAILFGQKLSARSLSRFSALL